MRNGSYCLVFVHTYALNDVMVLIIYLYHTLINLKGNAMKEVWTVQLMTVTGFKMYIFINFSHITLFLCLMEFTNSKL